MYKTKSKKRAWCKSIALIPVFIAAICVFSTKIIAQNDLNTLQTNESVGNPVTDNDRMITPEQSVSKKEKSPTPFSSENQNHFAQKSDTLKTAISPVAMNVLYIGIENPLAIAISGITCDKISATISQGTISKVSACEYIAKPVTPGKATVTVYAEIDGKKTFATAMDFRVKTLPVPVAKVAGKTGGNIDKDLLLSQKGIVAELENFLIDLRYVITQFVLEVATDEGVRTMVSNSPVFTDEQKQLINSLKKGQKVIFSHIKAKSTTGRTIDLMDMVFSIE